MSKKNPRKTEEKVYRQEEKGAAIALCYLAEVKDISVWNGQVLAHQILEKRLHELPDKIRWAIERNYEEALCLAHDVLG